MCISDNLCDDLMKATRDKALLEVIWNLVFKTLELVEKT